MFLVKLRSSKGLITFLLYNFILFTSWVCSSSVPREYGELKLFQTPVTYDLNSTVSIEEDNDSGKSMGYRIEAVVRVEPVWSDQETDFLLKFHLEAPRLAWRGRAARPAWPARPGAGGGEFYARLTHGAVAAAYLDRRDPPDLLNYKKSIISLFQFRAIDGENKETDISGSCNVVYESTSLTTIRKTKTGCESDEGEAWSRSATYWMSSALDALSGVRAEERVRLGRGGAALWARAQHALQLRAAAPRAARAAALHAALHALPPHLESAGLALQPDAQSAAEEDELREALAALLAADEERAGRGGELPAAHAALRALHALRRADAPRLLRLLRDAAYHPVLPWLYRLLGLSGSAAAHAAAAEHLQLGARDPSLALALHYLAGCTLAERVADGARAQLQALAERARAPAVADAALLAAAAQARRHSPAAARALKDHVTKALARCKDDECRVARLHALGNLALADTAEALVSHAERGAHAVALAALDALGGLPADALDAARRARLRVLAARAGRALEVRAAALELLQRQCPAAELRALARELRGAPQELRRVFMQRARLDAERDPLVAAALRDLDPEDLTWHMKANAGTSHVLSRATGWQLGERRARLHSAQLAAAGLLRRGRVALHSGDGGDEREELAVEVWTRGLEAVAGGSEEQREALAEGAADDAVRGGLRLRVRGEHAPGRLLFAGQAELLGHVWAGTASEPTPALRAQVADGARARRLPLLTGAELHYRAGELTAFAVDAQAQVSLWSRSARSALELRVAHARETLVTVRAGEAQLRVAAAEGAAPRLQLEAHLDFYDGVALCVRARLDDHERTRDVSARLAAGARALSRSQRARTPRAGRTLSLGRHNDAACRALAAADAA